MLTLDKHNLSQAVSYLRQGKTLVFPTETSYGLGCDATNQEAVDKIFQIKGRPEEKSLLIVVPSLVMAKRYIEWNKLTEELADKYWPGALTIVARKKPLAVNGLATGIISSKETVAVRVTNHQVLRSLSRCLDKPLVATSANLSGEGDIYDAEKIRKIFFCRKIQPDALLDYGRLPKRKPSTIVSVVGGEIAILRLGEIEIRI